MKRPTYLLFSLMLLLSVQPALSQTLSKTVEKHEGIDYQRLSRVDTILEQYLEKEWLVGAVVLVAKDNKLIYLKGHGLADVASKKPMRPDAIFRIMSQTKAITSLGIMQLFERGKLDLDQRISDFIPEFKNPKVLKEFNAADSTYTTVPAQREITFRDLLTHTSGIDYPLIGNDTMQAIYAKHRIPSGLGVFQESLLSKMKDLAALPLIHQPGERFTYGLNTDLLGCLIEVVSGETLEGYFNKHIFGPLGMGDSYFNVPRSKADRLPTVYSEDKNSQIIAWTPELHVIDSNYPLIPKSYFSGGAGLASTAHDYAVFLQMLLNGGQYNSQQLLGRRTTELMLSPQLPNGQFGDDNFTLGFALTSKKSSHLNMLSEGSFAWGGYYGTTYWADPQENLICLIMTQHTPNSHGEFVNTIKNVVYGSLK